MGYPVASRATEHRLTGLGEYNWQLRGRNGLAVYDRMRFSDPKVAGLRRAQNLPLLSAGVRIEPVDPEDAKAVEIADFIADVLLEPGGVGLIDPWTDCLRQFLLYLDYGYAPFEIVWAIQDGHAVIERFAYRPPSTIAANSIIVEHGRIVRVEQQTSIGTHVDIPGEKLLWFVHEREGDDFTGRSLLRPMYKPWYNKEKAEIDLLILLEKTGGIPFITEPESGSATAAVKAEVDAAMAAVHIGDRAYMRLPAGWTYSLESGSITLADGIEMVRYWDQQLSTVSMQQFLDLGTTPNGSRALGTTMSDLYLSAMGSVAKQVEDAFNVPGGPIHQLVAYNFAASEDYIPKLRFASLGKLDVKVLAAGLFQLHQMGMTFSDADWEWVREELDLPAAPERDETTPATPSTSEPASIPDEAPVDGVAAAESCGCAAKLAEGGRYWRPITTLERFVSLDEITERLDGARDELRDRTQATRDRMVAELVKRAQAAAKSGSPAKAAALAAGKAPMIDVLTREIRELFEEYFEFGRRQVHDELARQKNGEPVVDEITEERAGEALSMATEAPPRMTPKQARRFYELLDAEAEIAARAIGQAAVAETARVASTALRGTPPSAEVMKEAVRRVADGEALRAGFTVTKVIIHGRSAQAEAEREQIEKAVYSAILDGRTCEVCEAADGKETEDVASAESWAPNIDCLGTDARCRCMVIYTYKDGAS